MCVVRMFKIYSLSNCICPSLFGLFYFSIMFSSFIHVNSRILFFMAELCVSLCVCESLQSCLTLCDPMDGSPPGGSSGKEYACQCRRHRRRGFNPWVGKIPWRRKCQPTPVFLPEESHGRRNLVGYSPWGHRVRHD